MARAQTMQRKKRTGLPTHHRHLKGGKRPREYSIWAMVVQRCHNPECPEYQAYGGKGIRVCERWRWDGGFAAFLKDLGSQPFPGAGLRRLDEEGNFEPGNVRWADTRCRRL